IAELPSYQFAVSFTYIVDHRDTVRRYGTTQPPSVEYLPRKYINYTVKPDDTLQGIALKNDCSVSSIIRANKLWSVEALHLKTSIRIPIGNDGHRTTREIRSPRTETPKPVEKVDDRPQESMMDIFSRIDAAIKTTSTTVRKLERESTLDEIDRSHDECRPSRSRRQISLPKILHSDYYNELS
ncbi:LysM domain protein, partial [Cooperia oncophora]